MRIGQINKENYIDYLKLFSGFNNKGTKQLASNLSRLLKEPSGELDMSHEAREKRWVALGLIDEGMLMKDESWKKTVPVSDEVKNKIIETARRHFAKNGNGMTAEGDSEEYAAITREYYLGLPPSERLSAVWTLQQIQLDEERRMVDFVKAKDPSWTHGKPIDQDILEAAVSGKSFDLKI